MLNNVKGAKKILNYTIRFRKRPSHFTDLTIKRKFSSEPPMRPTTTPSKDEQFIFNTIRQVLGKNPYNEETQRKIEDFLHN